MQINRTFGWMILLLLAPAVGQSQDKAETAIPNTPFLKKAVILQAFVLEEHQAQMLTRLKATPGVVGYGIASGTTLAVQGRRMRVEGTGPLTVVLPPSKVRPARFIKLRSGRFVDMIAMNRAAQARMAKPFPPEAMGPVTVPKGTLIIVGGGLTRGILDRFIAAAGGADKSRIVVVPTANGPNPKAGQLFERMGVKNVHVVHAATRSDADTPEHLKLLGEATGIWFGGGRQWRIVDGFENTKCYRLMHAVLERGGVIGGSSAGATIQGEYLVRGDPLGNMNMMAEGYERGFGFLPGVAIDQHVAQRNRYKDMTVVKKRFNQVLCVGIDERTAMVVRKSVMEVMGEGKVHVYAKPDGSYESYAAGKKVDLITAKVLPAAP